MDLKTFNNLTAEDWQNALDFRALPGVDAQLNMAPPYRAKLIVENKLNNIEDPRIAAILILLYKQNNQWYFPVILRNTYKGVHSNQIGFPGGKAEKEDNNLAETALRETLEEINAQPKDIEVLGPLTPLYIPPSNFMVHPFVGITKTLPNFVPCDIEVNEIIQVNFAEFMLKNQEVSMDIHRLGNTKKVPAYQLPNGLKIWGASAMMLSEFYVFVKKSLNL